MSRRSSPRPSPLPEHPCEAGRVCVQDEEWSGHLHDPLPIPLPVRVLDFLCTFLEDVLEVVKS